MCNSETLSAPVIDLLEGMGWEWTTTPTTWKWLKFNPEGVCEAQQGDQCWLEDVEAADLLAAEDELEVWVPTMELRQQFRLPALSIHPILQQKWVRSGGGSSEWRDVGYVDQGGVPLV